MIAITNHKPVSFFDRVPSRARKALRIACDRVETRDTAEHQHRALALDLRPLGIEPPSLDDFRIWLEEVRLGRFGRKDYQDPDFVDPPHIADATPGPTVKVDQEDIEARLDQARAVVRAAHALFEAKMLAGFSPLSCRSDDVAVSEAVRELLEAEVEKSFDGIIYSDPVDVALAYLVGGDDGQNERLLDILTMDMQQELCRELVRTGAASDRSAT